MGPDAQELNDCRLGSQFFIERRALCAIPSWPPIGEEPFYATFLDGILIFVIGDCPLARLGEGLGGRFWQTSSVTACGRTETVKFQYDPTLGDERCRALRSTAGLLRVIRLVRFCST